MIGRGVATGIGKILDAMANIVAPVEIRDVSALDRFKEQHEVIDEPLLPSGPKQPDTAPVLALAIADVLRSHDAHGNSFIHGHHYTREGWLRYVSQHAARQAADALADHYYVEPR